MLVFGGDFFCSSKYLVGGSKVETHLSRSEKLISYSNFIHRGSHHHIFQTKKMKDEHISHTIHGTGKYLPT